MISSLEMESGISSCRQKSASRNVGLRFARFALAHPDPATQLLAHELCVNALVENNAASEIILNNAFLRDQCVYYKLGVIGKDGKIHKGGIWVFDAAEAGRFMGVAPGELPLGLSNGQIGQHWETTTDWWLKFGLIDERHPIDAGVNTAPLEAVLSE